MIIMENHPLEEKIKIRNEELEHLSEIGYHEGCNVDTSGRKPNGKTIGELMAEWEAESK